MISIKVSIVLLVLLVLLDWDQPSLYARYDFGTSIHWEFLIYVNPFFLLFLLLFFFFSLFLFPFLFFFSFFLFLS